MKPGIGNKNAGLINRQKLRGMSVEDIIRHVTNLTVSTQATRDQFFPCLMGTEQWVEGQHVGYRVNGSGDVAYVEIRTSHDYKGIGEAEICYLALGTVSGMDMRITTDFGVATESATTHTDTTDINRDVTSGNLYEEDISAALDGLKANDLVGLEAAYLNDTNALILGVRLRYL